MLLLLVASLCAAAHAAAPQLEHQWVSLIDARKIDEARELCQGWLHNRKDNPSLAEAHKCLANVELAGAQAIRVGKSSLSEGYGGPAVDRALTQLDEAMRLSPSDLSVHQGRMHVLLSSGRFDRLTPALGESLRLLKGRGGADPWLPYVDEMQQMGEIETALEFSQALAKRFPKDHRTIGNVAAFLAQLNRAQEALDYAKKAVALNPKDPIDLWNLGTLYDGIGKLAQADDAFRRSLAVETDQDTRRDHYCRYANFLDEKRHRRQAACELEKKYCSDEGRKACGSP